MQDFSITDEKAYAAVAQQVDGLILAALDEGGKTHLELERVLYENKIGNARDDSSHELAYSSTGAIFRSAVNSLRRRNQIYDSWDLGRDYERPFRYFRRNPHVI